MIPGTPPACRRCSGGRNSSTSRCGATTASGGLSRIGGGRRRGRRFALRCGRTRRASVNAAYRGQGLSLRVVEAALARRTTLGPDFMLLFCHSDRMGLYIRFGFAEVAAEVLVEHDGGQLAMPMHAMWLALLGRERPGQPARWCSTARRSESARASAPSPGSGARPSARTPGTGANSRPPCRTGAPVPLPGLRSRRRRRCRRRPRSWSRASRLEGSVVPVGVGGAPPSSTRTPRTGRHPSGTRAD